MKIARRLAIVSLFLTPIAGIAGYPGCPSTDGSALESWRDSAIQSGDWDSTIVPYAGAEVGTPAYELVRKKNKALRDANARFISVRDECFPGGPPACMQRMFRFVEANTTSGIPTTPAEEDPYRELPEEFRVSKKKNDKYRLFAKTSSGVQDLESYAKSKGWLTVRYKSRNSGGFDIFTTSLLMIQIPGSSFVPPLDYDRYVNIALPPDPEDKYATWTSVQPIPKMPIPLEDDYHHGGDLPGTTTMVTVKRATDATQARVFFTKFVRDPNHSKSSEFSMVKDSSLVNGAENCYQCHPNGLRAISPVGYQVRQEEIDRHQILPDAQWDAVRRMNNAMLMANQFKAVDFGQEKLSNGKVVPVVDPQAYGPIYGSTHPLSAKSATDLPTRTAQYIIGQGNVKGCAYSKDEVTVRDFFHKTRTSGSQDSFRFQRGLPVDWKKVASAMNCASCHNNVNRGALNQKLFFGVIAFKVLGDQSMPVGGHHSPLDRGTNHPDPKDILNVNERIALVNCLEAEFADELKLTDKWFKNMSCQSVAVADPRASGVNSNITAKPDSASQGLVRSNGSGPVAPSVNGN
jgi:hypothetical protein